MTTFQQYLIPWSVSQVVSLLILFISIKRPVWTRYIFAILFLAAGFFNWFTSLTTPEAYLMYATTAVGFYRDFINGWFRDHVTTIIPAIATGQLLIGAAMLYGSRWIFFGCIGIIIFLLAIAPLGLGSAFPFSVTVSVAAWLVYRHYKKLNVNAT